MSRIDNNYFTYRQTPTNENGTGTIESIKGNTLNWNQLVQNGNFADTSEWYGRDGATLTVSNNVGTLVTTNQTISAIMCRFSYVQNHKYLIKLSAKSSSGEKLGIGITNNNGTLRNPSIQIIPTTSWEEYSVIGLATLAPSGILANDGLVIRNMEASSQTVELKNVQVFDLTKMGLDSITSVDEFTALFPLSFYPYAQGELISFNGNGIKTVGKNLFNKESVTTGGFLNQSGGINSSASYSYSDFIRILPNQKIVISGTTAGGAYTCFYDENKNLISSSQNQHAFPYSYDAKASYVRVSARLTELDSCQIELGSTATSYEPYTSSTLSLPISTYFPNGMNSAYNSSSLTDIVRDELSQTKATKKVKQITYDGSSDENWRLENISSGSASGQHNFYISVYPAKQQSFAMNNMAVPYALYTTNYIDGKINAWVSSGQNLNFYPGTDITSVADFRTWLSNHPLTVNIALPTNGYEETPISPSLDLTFNIDQGGTEELLPSGLMNGSVDLGSLTWNYESTNKFFYTDGLSADMPLLSATTNHPIFCDDYTTTTLQTNASDSSWLTEPNKTIGYHRGGSATKSYIYIKDTDYTDVVSFTNAVQGVMLWYEKTESTPTTTPISCDILYRGMIPVSVNVYPLGSGTVTGSGEYRYGETATLVATSNDGIYRFLRYEDENGQTLSTDSTYSFKVGE